jgi:arylsulfatase A-like enzyme
MRRLLAALALVTAGSALPAPGAPPPGRPNIVVLLSDDAGYHEFGMQGAKTIATPRIDSIAQAGVRFTQGYVSGSVCSPSRAGLLTGRYQQRFGHEFNIPPAYSEDNGLPLAETLLPAVLQAAGYRTIAVGKWHLGYAPKFHPLARGFTDYYGFLQGSRSYWPLEKPGRLNQLLRDRTPVARERFDYLTDELAREAAAYIARCKDQPFFLYLAFNATHGPQHATEADLKQAGGNRIAAMTIALDRAVGLVLDALAQQGLTRNTLVVFLNDNGGASGHDNAPLRGHKGSAWEGGIRVPFALQWPAAVPAGQVYEHPVFSLDLFATALAAAGVTKSPGLPLDGVDLVPFLTGRAKGRPHQTLYWKSGANWAVRDGDLKLVVGDTGAPAAPALFDLAKDIGETSDLAAARADDVKRLEQLYIAWKATHQPTPWAGKRDDDEGDEPAAGDPKPRKRRAATAAPTP